jgi:tRNA 2-thiouridine synthesizing protein E
MVDKEKLADEFADAAKLMDKSVDTDIDSQQRTYRETELRDWNETQARNIASEAGIELTDAHMQVVQSLREHYREHGQTQSARQLSEMLYDAFASQGGKKYLYNLFPKGPVKQGMHIAGLPAPAHTEDNGFGTAR